MIFFNDGKNRRIKEIRYRAWDKVNKRMLYKGFTVIPPYPSNVYMDKKCSGDSYIGEMKHNITLMQYIGLKDCTGINIFEGDIIDISYCDDNFETVTVGDNGYGEEAFLNIFEWLANLNFKDIVNIEVKGNIYEGDINGKI